MEDKPLTILITTGISKPFLLECTLKSTIDWIKEKIEDHEGIRRGRYYLTYHGKCLNDKNTLEDYNFQAYDTMWVNIRLC